MTSTVVLIVCVGILGYQIFVSWLVASEETLSTIQKAAQLGIVWIAPLVGAGIVHWVLYGQSRESDKPSKKYAEGQSYDEHNTSPRIFND